MAQHSTPAIAHRVATEEALGILDRIRAEIAKGVEGSAPDWGHVGTINAQVAALREIADQMFNEGEYAHAACLRCGGSYSSVDGDPDDHRAHAAYEARLQLAAR